MISLTDDEHEEIHTHGNTLKAGLQPGQKDDKSNSMMETFAINHQQTLCPRSGSKTVLAGVGLPHYSPDCGVDNVVSPVDGWVCSSAQLAGEATGNDTLSGREQTFQISFFFNISKHFLEHFEYQNVPECTQNRS